MTGHKSTNHGIASRFPRLSQDLCWEGLINLGKYGHYGTSSHTVGLDQKIQIPSIALVWNPLPERRHVSVIISKSWKLRETAQTVLGQWQSTVSLAVSLERENWLNWCTINNRDSLDVIRKYVQDFKKINKIHAQVFGCPCWFSGMFVC